MRRYSITPLVEALRLEPGQSVARALNVGGTALTTMTICGLEERTAERLAVRAGLSPYDLWPEMLDQAIAEVERECAADDCTVTFLPPAKVPGKRYCSATCRRRVQRRAQYRQDPEFRERVKEQMRRYYRETRDYQLKRARKARARTAA